MKLIRKERPVCGAGDSGAEEQVVLVGVKLDDKGRELLTWTMMTVAESGDRVVALHVIEDSAAVGGTSSLMSLVKTFDSWLAVYEGFCNLKQVDLKVKVCRGGPSVRKVLVREAKSSGASKIVVGISQTFHTIHSSTSVAKYCARKLSKCFSIYAVNNGKIVFQREATSRIVDPLQGSESYSDKSLNENYVSASFFKMPDNSRDQLKEPNKADVNSNSWAIVPIQTTEDVSSSNSSVDEGLPDSNRGWPFLRSMFSHQGQHSKRSPVKNVSLVRRIFKLPSQNSSSVVYPDHKHRIPDTDAAGAIVPIGPNISWSPISPYHGLNGLPMELKDLYEKHSSMCRLFSYEELLSATSNFMPENMVGRGGSSHVYKGCLPDGKELAVKILKPSVDVLKEFVAEIEIITTLHHKNIISLFGFCFEHNYLILVYDFLSRGSLEENLHGNKDGSTFGWQERYQVALSVAEALEHLHNGCDQPVVHRDVKSSNILLSDDFEPQLSDFGLASRVTTSSSLICTDVSGTFGYLAPEYFMHGKVSDKVDVFAFGVVLLELLSGRMPIDRDNTKGQDSLVMWAKPILEDGKVSELLGPHIGSECDDDQIERMVLAATLCIRSSPRLRPPISLVLKLLQGDEEVRNWARQQVKMSEEAPIGDEEAFPTNIQSHLSLALLDIEDDSFSSSNSNEGISIEDYLQGRWSRTSSFN